MPFPTEGVLFSASTPPAPPGQQLCRPQTDGEQPAQQVTFVMPLATDTDAGAVKADGTSITMDADGTLHANPPGGGGGGGTGGGTGGSASGGLYVCVAPTPDPNDGTGTQWILPAPVLAGTAYWLNRNDAIQRQLGPNAYFTVQGTQLTLKYPLEGDGYLEFYYIQGTPNSETGGGGSVNPSPVSIVRGVNTATSAGTSCTITLPAGTQAGDLALLFVAAGLGPSAPVGWTQLSDRTSGVPGGAWSKMLTSGDISTGTVTCLPGSGSPLTVGIVTFIGPTAGVRELNTAAAGSSSIFGTNPTTTSSSVINTDVAIAWAGTLSPTGVSLSVTPGTTIGSISNANGIALIANAAMAGGATTFTFVATGSMTGGDEYVVIVKGS